MKQKHYVDFFSPGTLLSEVSSKEIDSWDVEKAKEMAREVVERHGATPYAFVFKTMTLNDDDFHPKETERSNLYYLGGKVETAEEILIRNDPNEKVLRENIRINRFKYIITNENSYKSTFPFFPEKDTLLDF